MSIRKPAYRVRVGDRINTTTGMREVLEIHGSNPYEFWVQDPATVDGGSSLAFNPNDLVESWCRTEDLRDGVSYRLTQDVKNPELNRAYKRDVQRVPWSKGDLFRASVRKEGTHRYVALEPVSVKELKGSYSSPIPQTHDGFNELCQWLEELPKSLADVLANTWCDARADEVIQRLIDDKLVTLEQVEAACVKLNKD